MIKTVTLTANQKTKVILTGGCHCCIENRGSGTVYASKKADIAADADGVTAISGGNSKILRNVARYEKNNDTYDYCGKVYLLSDSDGKAEIQTADDLHFFKSCVSGGGEPYDDTAVKAEISALQTGKVDKVTGKGLSSEDYTTAEKTKLSQLENYDDTDLKNRLNEIETYAYAYSGSATGRKDYYYCISESAVTGTSNFESVQTVLALRPAAVINSSSARFGIIQIQGRYDQNGDGTNDNSFTVVNVNWVLSSNIQTDNFFVVYNNAEKKIRLYYKASSTYDGVVAQKIFDDINSPSTPANPTVLVKDVQGVATLPDGWIISGSET